MQGDRRMRTDLNVKGAVFEFVIGNTLKTNFKQSKLFYDIRMAIMFGGDMATSRKV